MPTTQTNPMIEEYVARCSVLLWDLSPELQDQLREDIRQIVGEVAMELDGRPEDLLGPPLRFVRELRLAAGLPEIPAAEHLRQEPSTPESPWLVVASVLLQLLRTARAAAWRWTKELASDLRPAWWVARGVGLAFILGAITGWDPQGWLPNLFNSQFLGLFSTVGLVIGSVQLGRRGPTTLPKRIAWAAVSIAAFVALVGFASEASYVDSYAYENMYLEPIVGYHDAATIAEPVLTANNGLGNFIDPSSGAVLETAEPQIAVLAARDLLARTGPAELIVEFRGHQHRTYGSDLVPMVQSLFP